MQRGFSSAGQGFRIIILVPCSVVPDPELVLSFLSTDEVTFDSVFEGGEVVLQLFLSELFKILLVHIKYLHTIIIIPCFYFTIGNHDKGNAGVGKAALLIGGANLLFHPGEGVLRGGGTASLRQGWQLPGHPHLLRPVLYHLLRGKGATPERGLLPIGSGAQLALVPDLGGGHSADGVQL